MTNEKFLKRVEEALNAKGHFLGDATKVMVETLFEVLREVRAPVTSDDIVTEALLQLEERVAKLERKVKRK